MSYVYIQSESAQETGCGYPLYTVGFYGPDGQWEPESDHGGENGLHNAATRVAHLNGGGIRRDLLEQAIAKSDCSACNAFLRSLLEGGSRE